MFLRVRINLMPYDLHPFLRFLSVESKMLEYRKTNLTSEFCVYTEWNIVFLLKSCLILGKRSMATLRKCTCKRRIGFKRKRVRYKMKSWRECYIVRFKAAVRNFCFPFMAVRAVVAICVALAVDHFFLFLRL